MPVPSAMFVNNNSISQWYSHDWLAVAVSFHPDTHPLRLCHRTEVWSVLRKDIYVRRAQSVARLLSAAATVGGCQLSSFVDHVPE